MHSTLLDRHHVVPGGDRVRLRLPHLRDRDEVHTFLGSLGLEANDLDVRRGLRWTPGERWAVVATRWDGARERVIGLATADGDGTPTLLAEEPEVCDLLSQALADHAGAPGRRVA